MSVNQTVENVYLRQEAAQITRRHFWRLLGMSAIVYALTALVEYLLTQLGDLLMAKEVQAVLNAGSSFMNAEHIRSTDPMLTAWADLFLSPKFWGINLVFMIAIGLLRGGLNLGYTTQLIDTGRGGIPRVMGVFSRMRYCLKAWGLLLWTGLKLFLWGLPGVAMLILGAELQLYELYEAGNLVMIIGMVLLFALVIRALLRYSQATHILADEPDRGIRECVSCSKGMMKNRKWQYFKLSIPVILRMTGVGMAVGLTGELILVAAGLDADLLAMQILQAVINISGIYFLLQMNVLFTMFYLKQREPAADAPVSYWLRKPEEISTQPVSAWLAEHAADETPAEAAGETETPLPDTNDEKEITHEQSDC